MKVTAPTGPDLGYMAKALVQASLPHKRTDSNEFIRVNGNLTLTLQGDPEFGLPYGPIPRLLLAFIITQAVKKESRFIELGGKFPSITEICISVIDGNLLLV